MASIDNVIENLKTWPARNIIGLLAVVIVSVAGVILLVTWANNADYQVLYSNLSEDDAGRIVEELGNRKIPYKLNGTGTILVASNKVYDLRLQLASKGLPQGGGIGFEIFDNTSFTTSEFVQKLNYRRALEGELARTIRSLSAVSQSRVHLVIPDKTVFAFQEEKPESSAAVFVTLNRGGKLSRKEVEGIVHLVASSVEDLRPENITVIDNRGNLLTSPSDDTMMGLTGSQMEFQQGFEKSLASKIISILEPVVGRNKVKATVSASFDFTRSERTEELYDPDLVVVRSEQKTTEKTISGLGSAAGIPGAASNLPGGAGATAGSSGSQSQRQEELVNYETSKTIKRVVEAPVTLERMTVAILIDGILPSQKESVENADQYVVRSEEDIRYYEDIVKKAIGFTEDRGDEISVKVMPFTGMDTPEVVEASTDYLPIVLTVLKYFIPLVIALLFFFVVLRPLISSLTRPAARTVGRVVVGEEEESIESPLKPREIPLEKQVIEWASNNPQQATGLVKGWIEEK
jgi:flagellar M-ring protein FliF